MLRDIIKGKMIEQGMDILTLSYKAGVPYIKLNDFMKNKATLSEIMLKRVGDTLKIDEENILTFLENVNFPKSTESILVENPKMIEIVEFIESNKLSLNEVEKVLREKFEGKGK